MGRQISTYTIESTQDIQSNLDALNRAGGGTLQLLSGVFVQPTPLTMYSNTDLVGISDTATMIKFVGAANLTLQDGASNNKIAKLALTGSSGTALVATNSFNTTLEDITFSGNNKGFTFTTFNGLQGNRLTVTGSVSNGYELTNGSFAYFTRMATVSNGGHGVVLNNVTTGVFQFSSANANTTDGFNCTSLSKVFFNVEAAGNGGNGINFVATCANSFISGYFTGNTGDGAKLTETATFNQIIQANFKDNTGWGVNIAAASCANNYIISPVYNNNTAGSDTNSGTSTIIV